jgi:hypothetical protein
MLLGLKTLFLIISALHILFGSKYFSASVQLSTYCLAEKTSASIQI